MLRRIRIVASWVFFICAAMLVLDLTGVLHLWLGWVARVQLVEAVLAVNVAALVVVGLLTLLLGRVYCSTLCPLGALQDGASWVSGRRKGKKRRFRHSRPATWLRYVLLAVFIGAMLVASGSLVTSLLDPWANFGRIAHNFMTPLWRTGNNLLAWVAGRIDSYAIHSADVYVAGGVALGVAALWLVGLVMLAWWRGRLYCNSICPVGTFLGVLSRVSLFRPTIERASCTGCGVCEKLCRSECIDLDTMTVDRSRCVVCFDCVEGCRFGAMKYTSSFHRPPAGVPSGMASSPAGDGTEKVPAKKAGIEPTAQVEAEKKETTGKSGIGRRDFFSITALVAAASPAVIRAQQVERVLLNVDGGLADIAEKRRPERATPITPPGSGDARAMARKCVACQLCVAACPNGVLTPSSRLASLMQPEMTFERGYCRPECVECGEVCPTGAIARITPAEKTSIAVGRAHYVAQGCVVTRDNVPCTECERHCPTKAISLVPVDPTEAAAEAAGTRRRGAPPVLKTPVVDTSLCIGCGACEHLCPARPLAAIRVEGNSTHHLL